MKRLLFAIGSFALMCMLFGCAPALSGVDPFETEAETESDLPIPEPEPPTVSLDRRRYSFTGDPRAIEVKDDLLTVKQEGVYRLTGTLSEGGIAVDVGFGETVCLILDGVSIRSSFRPAIFVKSAAAVIIETKEGSVNPLYSAGDSVIKARGDLILRGNGSLSLSGADTAVNASATVTVESGMLRATASEYGILAEKRLEISGGDVAVNAARIGYATGESSPEEGGIYLMGGQITAVTSEAALSAQTNIWLQEGIGSFDAPILYRCEREENGRIIRGSITHTGGSFPPIPS
ncbi:MAG: carbohydrate-binding domain-containing protein [Clostridia bacterium]|nr:carbohydrate-binding domain-containing protein [Clostridia bacterium]